MDIKQYKERVCNFFKESKATEQDWEVLGKLFLAASENGDEGMEDFDRKLLTKQEFNELYETTLNEIRATTIEGPGEWDAETER